MNWKEFAQAKFETFCLFGLLLLLMATHGFMMHYARPTEMIHWVEELIGGDFAAILVRLNPTSK